MPGSIVANDAAGVAKVLSGNFAYVIKSVFITQAINKHPGKLSRGGGDIGSFFLTHAVQKSKF
jgi:hypothetical protein